MACFENKPKSRLNFFGTPSEFNAMKSLLSILSRLFNKSSDVIAALLSPKVNAPNDIDGLLNISNISIIKGGGIIRNKNDIPLMKNRPELSLNININIGGSAIAIQIAKTLKKIVSKISFKNSYGTNLISTRDDFTWLIKFKFRILKSIKKLNE